MRPRGVPSKWVKVLPWYFTGKKVPARAAEEREAFRYEEEADR